MLKSCLGAFCSRQVVKTVLAFLQSWHVMLEAPDVFHFSHYEVFHIYPFCSGPIISCIAGSVKLVACRLKLAACCLWPSLAGSASQYRLLLIQTSFIALDPRSIYVRDSPLAGLQDGSGLKFGQAPPDVQGRGHCYFRLDPRSNLSFVIGRNLLTKRVGSGLKA